MRDTKLFATVNAILQTNSLFLCMSVIAIKMLESQQSITTHNLVIVNLLRENGQKYYLHGEMGIETVIKINQV